MWNDFELAGRKCHIYESGYGGPVLFWGTMVREPGSLSKVSETLEKTVPDNEPFTLFVFEADDWNKDFSPWVMDAGEGMRFSGEGRRTLDWLLDEAVPYVDENYPQCSEKAVVGYSLAGLFALWAFYECKAFRGVACCSGSLWFEGWDRYAETAKAPEDSIAYLSLGGKEPGSGNTLTASIGVQYHKQELRMKGNSNIRSFTYIQNSGGHFADPAGRVAKAMAWLIYELISY